MSSGKWVKNPGEVVIWPVINFVCIQKWCPLSILYVLRLVVLTLAAFFIYGIRLIKHSFSCYRSYPVRLCIISLLYRIETFAVFTRPRPAHMFTCALCIIGNYHRNWTTRSISIVITDSDFLSLSDPIFLVSKGKLWSHSYHGAITATMELSPIAPCSYLPCKIVRGTSDCKDGNDQNGDREAGNYYYGYIFPKWQHSENVLLKSRRQS